MEHSRPGYCKRKPKEHGRPGERSERGLQSAENAQANPWPAWWRRHPGRRRMTVQSRRNEFRAPGERSERGLQSAENAQANPWPAWWGRHPGQRRMTVQSRRNEFRAPGERSERVLNKNRPPEQRSKRPLTNTAGTCLPTGRRLCSAMFPACAQQPRGKNKSAASFLRRSFLESIVERTPGPQSLSSGDGAQGRAQRPPAGPVRCSRSPAPWRRCECSRQSHAYLQLPG